MNLVAILLTKNKDLQDNVNKYPSGNTFIIFGGTGDLAHRKLYPAIYNLAKVELLPEDFALVSIGRRNYTNTEYKEKIYQSIRQFSRFKLNEDLWKELEKKFYYINMDFTNQLEYQQLKTDLGQIDEKHHTSGNHIYYLAVAPEFFDVIVSNLHKTYMHEHEVGYSRVVIEKPFGKNLESAEYLNQKIIEVFTEENTYRIDHYLGKEMLQNIMVIRFANSLFEPLWNNQYIEQVQISSSETLGVEMRGDYYEKSGAIRDMVQSHLLQLLSLVAMEKPLDLKPHSIRDEKVKVLKSLKKFSEEDINQFVVRGQYGKGKNSISYREETKVSSTSNTETFVAMRLEVDNKRWKNVPFYIRTGKKMPKKSTEIIIQFKMPDNLLYDDLHDLTPNTLVIKIQPTEGVYLQFNAKKPGTRKEIIPVNMDFCQNCEIGINSPEAYERLLYDVMRGDATLFARWDEVEYSWQFIDKLIETWQKKEPDFPNYEAGTYGPKEADMLLKNDNKEWLKI